MERSTSRALMLETATNDPAACSARMTRAQARMQSNGPRALTRSTRSNSSGSMSVSRPAWPTPAVIVTWPGTPQRRRVSSTAASTAAGFGHVAGHVARAGDVPDHRGRPAAR